MLVIANSFELLLLFISEFKATKILERLKREGRKGEAENGRQSYMI